MHKRSMTKNITYKALCINVLHLCLAGRAGSFRCGGFYEYLIQ